MPPDNAAIARILERVAELLEAQDDNPFRVRSYRNAALQIRDASRQAAEIVASEGVEGLHAIPGVGEGLARSIGEIVETGRLTLLDRLESEHAPENLLMRLPGIGPKLAHRLHEEFGAVTLEELEQAVLDGRLQQVEGIGRKKAETIGATIAGMLGARRFRGGRPAADRPSVQTLLDVDHEYRTRAAQGELPKIAPRRFNPAHERWLPVLHTRRGDWEFTALFSNTQRAHNLGTTHDWVVIYYHRDRREDQCTVVTAMHGPMAGRRVVRGRESECRDAREAR